MNEITITLQEQDLLLIVVAAELKSHHEELGPLHRAIERVKIVLPKELQEKIDDLVVHH